MKCRYPYCKLGKEVEKDVAIRNGNMYYHSECFEKYIGKQKVIEKLKLKGSVRDANITLKKAVDEIGYSIGYVEYVTNNKLSEIKTPYNLLYHLKIEQNYNEYIEQELYREKAKINYEIKNMDIKDDNIVFNYEKKSSKRYKIY